MTRTFLTFLAAVTTLALAVPAALAGTDEFLGDASIYSGVPTTSSKPNVLIIIDNSRSTENTANGRPFRPWVIDPDTGVNLGPNEYDRGFELDHNGNPTEVACTGSDPRVGCFDPWGIYVLDNQGDFSTLLVNNADEDLDNLTCDPSGDGSKPIHKSFIEFGSYSGSASPQIPTLAVSGGRADCVTSGNNNAGVTYALGNYLNYTKRSGSSYVALPSDCDVPTISLTLNVPGECRNKNQDPCTNWKTEPSTTTGYFQLRKTITNPTDPATHPQNGDGSYWADLGVNDPEPGGLPSSAYDPTFAYEFPACAEETSPDIRTQREVLNIALKQVISATAGVVNFGAMVYGGNNSGSLIIEAPSGFRTDMQDLSRSLTTTVDGVSGIETVIAPDCNDTANVDLALCKFLAALPGPGEADGAPRISSNANRPLAESVFDAGYYYGATYTPVTNNDRIPEAVENPCGFNHIILLTNGFSNGDGSPNLDVIGDADGDGQNEEVYGLGSHWLDDVAKYLRENYEIKTHTVLAFQSSDALIQNAAKDGEGQFYNVYSAEELSAALLKLLTNIINESNTSFVAPVVPASTTNRTISSNKVYLGLFRPQQDAQWHGNIKKYGLSFDTNLLTDINDAHATDAYGNFDRDSISYWSLAGNGMIPSATNTAGYIDPNEADPNKPHGDGGQVDAGGAGGVLLERMVGLLSDIRTNNDWQLNNTKWRRIYTYLEDAASPTKELWQSQNRFIPTNNEISTVTLGLYDTTVDPPVPALPSEKDKLILYLHGFDVEQPVLTWSNVDVRNWVLGDVLHSRPLVFNYTKYADQYDGTCPPTDNTDVSLANTWNSSMIYVGANDGMMHAFRDCDGQELWAFIPPNSLEDLQYIKNPEAVHASFVDSAPSVLVYDQNENGIIEKDNLGNYIDKVVLLFGQRRGGGTDVLDTTTSRGAYTALDVSDPYKPKLLWQFDNAILGELGETWSQPRMAKVRIDDNHFKVLMFVGVGYDNNEDFRFGNTQTFRDSNGLSLNTDATPGGDVDGGSGALVSSGSLAASARNAPRGRGIVAIEVADYTRASSADNFVPTISGGTVGTAFWAYTNSASTSTDQYNAELQYSFASDLTVVDFNSDGYADTIYSGDTGGNLWRFDISNSSNDQWSGEILFKSNPGADGTNGRKIFYRPVVVNFGAPHIYFGTGDREHPLNLSTTDRLYCVIDWGKPYPAYKPDEALIETDLDDMTANQIQDVSTSQADADDWRKRLYSSPLAPYNPFGAATNYTNGWYIKLDGTDRDASGDPGEKMLAPPTVFNGEVFFSTYQLYMGARAGCEAGNLGISRLYHLDYKTAEAVRNYVTTNDSTTLPGNSRAVGATKDDGSVEILQRVDRVRTLGEGIPSGIVTLIDASGKVTQLISSSDKVESSKMTDVKLISPVYWMQW